MSNSADLKLARMQAEDRQACLLYTSDAADPVVASAILTAPSFLSGLSDTELTLVKHKIESHIAPEIAEARAVTLKALKQAEIGWQKAMSKIGECAGLALSLIHI